MDINVQVKKDVKKNRIVAYRYEKEIKNKVENHDCKWKRKKNLTLTLKLQVKVKIKLTHDSRFASNSNSNSTMFTVCTEGVS